jgi:hypothetical protein
VLITHGLDEAVMLADRIAVITAHRDRSFRMRMGEGTIWFDDLPSGNGRSFQLVIDEHLIGVPHAKRSPSPVAPCRGRW